MLVCKDSLKADPTVWLLERNNPSVRYFTLKEILERPPDDPDVDEAKAVIMTDGIIPKILAKQHQGGYWEKAEDFYIRTKFRGTVWQLIILAEVGADGHDHRVKKACEFILKWSQDRQSGGFAYTGSENGGGHHSKVLPCLTGNIVWSLIRLGFIKDPRVQQGIHWITKYQRFDDGSGEALGGWPYEKHEMCWGQHTCHLGVVKGLKALGEIPDEQRNGEIQGFLRAGTEFLMKHHIYKRSHDLKRIAKPKWIQLGFPWMWDTDVLEMLSILTQLGHKDERMKEAVDLVISKQDDDGKWTLENTYNGRFQVNIEQKKYPSKWITFHALRMLKNLSSG